MESLRRCAAAANQISGAEVARSSQRGEVEPPIALEEHARAGRHQGGDVTEGEGQEQKARSSTQNPISGSTRTVFRISP